ncbi:MAG: GNAT family N-acetyltransferase, partial [Mycobacterium sp.]
MTTTELKERFQGASGEVVVGPLRESEVDEADRVMRLAFGTFLGAPDPATVFGDAEMVRPRFAAEPSWAFAAEIDGELVGSSFATRWGSFGFVGPVTVRPDLWDRGIAGLLMQPVVDLLDRWQLRQAALFTFPHSPKHIGLYQKFGFWPQHLTPVLEQAVAPTGSGEYSTYSSLPDIERPGVLAACQRVTGAIFEGLDVGHEIRATATQALGDTVLIRDSSQLVGFAVCHLGAGEAGSGACFVKFAAVRPGPDAGNAFERLLDECEVLAAER